MRIGGDPPVHPRLGTQQGDIGQAVTTRATATARSRITLAGSWIANGLRNGDRACDNAVPSPVVVIVWVNSTPPA